MEDQARKLRNNDDEHRQAMKEAKEREAQLLKQVMLLTALTTYWCVLIIDLINITSVARHVILFLFPFPATLLVQLAWHY